MADYHPPRDRTHGAAAPTTNTPGARRPPAPGPGPAGALLHLQSTAGNHAVQRLMARNAPQPAAATIQRYVPNQAQKIDLDQSAKLKAWIAIDSSAKKKLLDWCKSHKQALSLIDNFTWEEFRLVSITYSSGAKAPTSVPDIRAQLVRDRTDKFRTTGRSADGWGYKKYLAENLLTVTHTQTFRTIEEKRQGKGQPQGTVPYTRSFTAQIGGKPALWEIHIHYAGNNTAQNAHSKLIVNRTKPDSEVANLGLGTAVVAKCTSLVKPIQDAQDRGRNDW